MRVLFTGRTYLCLCFIKVIVLAASSACFSTAATYLSSCSFMYLCFLLLPCRLKSTVQRVGVKTLCNTLPFRFLRIFIFPKYCTLCYLPLYKNICYMQVSGGILVVRSYFLKQRHYLISPQQIRWNVNVEGCKHCLKIITR